MSIQAMRTAFGFTLLLVTCLFLYGCAVQWYTKAECEIRKEGHSCRIEGGMEGGWLTTNPTTTTNIQGMKLRVEPVNVNLTNSSGSLLLKLSNASGLVAAKTFSYYRNGQYLYITNPSAVSSWVNMFSDLNSVIYEIRDIQYNYATSFAPGSGETASLKVTAYYNNEPVSSGTTYIPDICDSRFAWQLPRCGPGQILQ